MAVKSLSVREMEKQTKDVYEAVNVISKRARQINQNRFMEQALKNVENEELGVFDELPQELIENYEEEIKSTTQAISEFIGGSLTWKKSSDLDH